MNTWKLIWIIAMIGGTAGFAYISFMVTIRGIAEVRSLLMETSEE